MPEYGNVHGLPRLTCRLCGECDLGCNDGAKNTLDHTYLSAARHHGADLRTRHEVKGFRPRDGGGYEVTYVVHTGSDGESSTGLSTETITCERLVLAAGTFGTTFLLLRNRHGVPGDQPDPRQSVQWQRGSAGRPASAPPRTAGRARSRAAADR